ncbi:MAG: VCBS repeat-containing protein [Anaerolineae bacterium]|nr:VCBS repeat-containing protein [Anaerolineae bacterium]
MKKRALSLFLICALLLGGGGLTSDARQEAVETAQDTEVVSVSFTFQAPIVERVGAYDRVTMPGLPSHGDPGAPVLPLRVARILLPYGAQVTDVEVVAGDGVTLPGPYQVEPGQEWVPTSVAPEDATPPDPAIYGAGDLFPGVFYARVSVQRLHGYAILLLKLYPVQYLPQTGELTYYPQLTVNVEMGAGLDGASTPAVVVPGQADRVRDLVDNPQALDSYTGAVLDRQPTATSSLVSPADPCDYIVITSQALSPTFQSLVDWKVTKGLSARVYATEDIYAEYTGDDNAERVRNFIVDAYAAWSSTAHPLQYVVLGGDTEVIPIRLVRVKAGGYTTMMPVDLYYGGLDGDWDADGDGSYGEPDGDGAAGEEVDFFAEVYVGRIPVETVSEAAYAISKTLRYEQNPTADYLDRALWLGRKLDDYTWGGNSKDLVSNLAPQYNVTTLYDRDGTYSTSKVINAMNAGVHLANFDGHGNWSCCPLNRSEISGLTNDEPFFFYNLGCETAEFDGGGEEAVAEYYVFTEHGAFAYIGNTRYGWYSPGSTNGPGNQLDRLFFDYAVNTADHNIGKALQLAKEDYYPGHRWSILTLSLFGDPETALVTELIDPVANISSPLGGKTVRRSVDVIGAARAGDAPGATFDHYVLEYGAGSNPSSWTQIGVTGTVPVSGSVLAVWDTTLLADGTYTLRLRVSDGVGHTSLHKHIVTTDNIYITSPTEGALVNANGPLTITGSAWSTDFQDYVVEYGRGASPSSWTVIVTSTTPVTDGVLAVWNPSSVVEADDYTIRLTRHGSQLDASERVTVYIDPLWQAGWPQEVTYRVVAHTVSAGDLDNDGDLELLVPMNNYGSSWGYVYAWHHDGTRVSGWPRSVNGGRISAATLADLDRDGDLEVLVGVEGGKVYAWHHTGQVVLGWPQTAGGDVFGAPAVADLDRDGVWEVVAAAVDGYVYAWRQDGSAVPGWPKDAGGSLYVSPALGDLDGDGKLEVVVARQGAVYAWHHDGTALAGWPVTEATIVSDVVGSPAVGDIDGNGDMEIVLAAGDRVYAWHHTGTAVSNWPQSISGAAQSSPALGDIDGNGDLEIVVASDQVYAWHGDGTPVSGWPKPVAEHTNSSPVLGDITGDGQADVVIGAGDGDAHIYAWQGDGNAISGWPRFVPAFSGSGSYYERLSSPIVTDLDRDGDVEVAIGAEEYVFVFDLSTAYAGETMEWPIFQHDLHFTGVYTEFFNLPPFVRDAQVDPGYVVPGGTVTITARVTDEDGVASATADVESPDENVLAALVLYDDGAHGDGAAGDGVYGNFWTTPMVEQEYLVDIAAVDGLGNGCAHDNAGSFTSTDVPYVQFDAFTIHYEDRFENGVFNPGEYIRGAITLENIGVLGTWGVTATLQTADVCIVGYEAAPVAFGDIAAGGTATSGDEDFYLSIDRDCPSGHVASLLLNIYDQSGNHWVDRFEITIIDNVGPYLSYAFASPGYLEAGQPVTITAYLEDSNGIPLAQAVIESPDETVRATLTLSMVEGYGGLGGSGVFRAVWVTDGVPRTYKVDFVAQDGIGNESSYDNRAKFTTEDFTPKTDILLVVEDEYEPEDGLIVYYREALDAIAVSYDVWDTYLYGTVYSDTLQAYTDGVVVWAAPTWGHLSDGAVRDALTAYLGAGGRLFITGQNVGLCCDGTTFYGDYLHASYEADNARYWDLAGIVGDPIGDGLQIGISGGDGADNQYSPEQIAPLSPAVAVFEYDMPGAGAGAIRVDTGTYKVVYFGFGFEAINSAQDRVTVMYRVLDWLLDGIAPSVDFSAAPTSGGLPLTVTMTGTLVGMAQPYTVTWDFGDGHVETPASLATAHTFTEAGTFDVVLTVQNATSTVSATHTIAVTSWVFLPLVRR